MKEHFNFSKWPAEKHEEKALMGLETHQKENNIKEKTMALLNEFHVISLRQKKLNNELKKSFQSLVQKHETFISLYNLAPVCCLILDHAGVIVDINQRGAELLKMPKDAVMDKRFHSFISKDNLGDFYDFLQQIKKSATRKSMEIRLSLNIKEHVYARMEGIAIQNQSATKIKYYITVVDITANRKSQLTLQQTKDHSRLLLCNSNSGAWALRSADRTMYLDDSSCAILGLKPSQFDGSINQIIQCIHADDQEKTRFCMEDGIALNKEIDTEFRVITNAGQLKFISFKGHEVANFKKDGMCYSGILMDYSEPKRLEEETKDLRRKQERLILSATLTAQEKERAAISSALHDSVCQVLYGIRLNLQSLQFPDQLKDEFVTINQLLDQAIMETRQISYELTPSVLKDFGFSAGIKEMAQRLYTPTFQIQCSIKSSADLLPPKVQLCLFRIIQELINNSIKHAKASLVKIKVGLKHEEVTVSVADNGIGFDATAKDAFNKGLGLSGIKNKVFLLDGTIVFKSSKKGTTTTIKFKNDSIQIIGAGNRNY